MRTWLPLLLSALLTGCSPLSGSWSGVCEANGSWALDLRLSPSGDDLEGAERPGQWSAVHGDVIISPSLGSIRSAEVTLYHCPEAQAPCSYLDGSSMTEADGGFIQGEILDPTMDEDEGLAMRFFGRFIADDEEIEGSCYNLVDGGSGGLRLDR